jgi:hypothetical protein
MSKRNFVVWRSLRSDHGNCSYAIIDDTLVVKTHLGTATHHRFDGIDPEALARVMTWEINLTNAPGHTE